MSDSTRWGVARWGDEQFAVSEEGAAHQLSARFGFDSKAEASRLGSNHPLIANAHVVTRGYQVGLGPVPIHPLNGVAIIDSNVSTPPLTYQHNLLADVRIDAPLTPAGLTMGHKMNAELRIDALSSALLNRPHALSAIFIFEALASAADLDLSHPLAALVRIASSAEARYAAVIPLVETIDAIIADPTILILDPNDVIPGAVNLIRNPSVELTIVDWLSEGPSTLAPLRENFRAWDATWSARINVPGGFADEGVAIRTKQSLDVTPIGGSVLWAQAWLSSEAAPEVQCWTRVRYIDGTIVDGDRTEPEIIVATGLENDWQRIVALQLTLDETKTIDYAELVIVRPVPGGASWWLVDGAQIEYDPYMFGPQPVVIDVLDVVGVA